MKVVIKPRSLKVLDFDIENRPLSYLGSDWTTADITAIAWKFIGTKGKPTVMALGEVTTEEMLTAFVAAYNEADIVTGHYIRGHDLAMINGALIEFGMPALSEKLTHDTKLDMLKRKGMSNSQENIGAMLATKAPKIDMTAQDWRQANRLTPEGIAKVKIRVAGDVEQHIEMRQRLIEGGYLGPPKLWSPEQSGSTRYSG